MTRVLSDYETILRERVTRVSILGEIEISKEEWRDLGELIAARVRKYGCTDGTELLRRDVPCAFACFLVAHGVYAYEGGDYWSEIVALTGIDTARLSIKWGQFFEDFLVEHDLAVFPVPGHRRYVDQILIHGGIPNYCLRDFFVHLVLPSLTWPDLDDLTTEELVEEWLHLPAIERVDLPIFNFLVHGGQVMLDFITRVMEMVQVAAEGQPLSHTELHLPKRVVERFQPIFAGRGTTTEPSARLHPPRIVLDPWGGTLLMELPEQSITDSGRRPACSWTVTTSDGNQTISASSHIRSGCWVSNEITRQLTAIEGSVTISFARDQEIIQKWTRPLIDRDVRLLAFDADQHKLLSPRAPLPRRSLWLVYPEHAHLTVESGVLIEEGLALYSGRRSYRVECWDLAETTRLVIDETEIAVESSSRGRATLAGEPAYHQGGEWPLYIGTAPDLLIPTARRYEGALTGWTLTIRDGRVSETYDLSTITDISWQGTTARISLDSLAPVRDRSLGQFTVTLRGTLGNDADLRFGLARTLQIQELPRLRLPDQDGALAPGEITLTVGRGVALTAGEPGVHVEHLRPGVYRLTAPPEAATVSVRLREPQSSQEEVQLTLALPVIQWALTTAGRLEHAPGTVRLNMPHAWLLSADSPALHIRVAPAGGAPIDLYPRLLVTHTPGQPAQVVLPAQRSSGSGQRLFDLRGLVDTVRASGEACVAVRLEVSSSRLSDRPVTIPVLIFERERPQLTSLAVESAGAHQHVTAKWRGGDGIRRSQLRLWPLWQPWAPVITLDIPDGARGQASWTRTDSIPPGDYRAQIIVNNDWSVPTTTRPGPQANDIVEVSIGTPTERSRLLQKLPDSVQGHCIRLLASTDDAMRRQHLDAIARTLDNRDLAIALHVLVLELERVPLETFLNPHGWHYRLLGIVRRNPAALWDAVEPFGATLSAASRNHLEAVLRMLGLLHLVELKRGAHQHPIRSVALSANGTLLASGDERGEVKLWRVERGTLTYLRNLSDHRGFVASVAISQDGTVVASAGADGIVRLWDSVTGELRARLEHARGPVSHLAFSLNGSHLAVCSDDRRLAIWRVRDGVPVWSQTVPGTMVSQIAFSPDKQRIAAATGEGAVIWHLERPNQIETTLKTPKMARSLAFRMPEGDLLAVGCTDGFVYRRRIADQQSVTPISSTYGVVHTVAFRCDGQSLAVGYGKGVIALWRMCSGELIQIVSAPGGAVTSLAFSADGHTLVACDSQGTLKLYSSAPRW